MVSRAVYPASELATTRWIKENSAVCELTGYDIDKISKDKLYPLKIPLKILLAFCLCNSVFSQNKTAIKIPVIVITDLYPIEQLFMVGHIFYKNQMVFLSPLPVSHTKIIILTVHVSSYQFLKAFCHKQDGAKTT